MSHPSSRIIGHMNKDHQLALVDYVVTYGKVPFSSFKPESVQITSVDEKTLSLAYQDNDSETKTLQLNWEAVKEDDNVSVISLLDIKAKLIAMAKYAAAAQGYSHKQLTTISFPNNVVLYGMYTFAAVVAITLYDKTLLRRIFANDAILSMVVAKVPQALATSYAYFEGHVKQIALAVYAIHVAEIFLATLPILTKFRAPALTKLAWMGMNFVEGFLANLRLKKTVA